MKDPNTPAFPVSVPGHLYGDGSSELPYVAQEGLTKLEFFAAHAPVPAPGWFKPVMPTERPKSVFVSDDDKRTYTSVIEAERKEGDCFYNQTAAAQEMWDLEYKIRTVAQWPWCWASQVLAAQK